MFGVPGQGSEGASGHLSSSLRSMMTSVQGATLSAWKPPHDPGLRWPPFQDELGLIKREQESEKHEKRDMFIRLLSSRVRNILVLVKHGDPQTLGPLHIFECS